jgi:hypothetical protein
VIVGVTEQSGLPRRAVCGAPSRENRCRC